MDERVLGFYDEVAELYHLMFEDWEGAIARQAKIIGALLAAAGVPAGARVLDCACGAGTQALGLAAAGYKLTGSDLTPAMIQRARREAKGRGLTIEFHVSDMRSLGLLAADDSDAVIAMDNALPHLEGDELRMALRAIFGKLSPGGTFMASIRDYDTLLIERPQVQTPAFYGESGSRRIVHQLWDWQDRRTYAFHLYITRQVEGRWVSHHIDGVYHCVLRSELTALMREAGFAEVRWLMPEESGFYQPVVVARKGEFAGKIEGQTL